MPSTQSCFPTFFAKAFERVNPWWVLQCLAARAAPAWIKAYVIHLMFGRRTQHKVQGFLLEPISIHQGLAMGRATSVVLFCLALDPLIWALHDISSFIRLTAYMDDNSAASKGLHWVEKAQRTFEPAHSAGLQVLRHQCFQAGFISLQVLPGDVRACIAQFGVAWIESKQLPPSNTLTIGGPSLHQALCLLLQQNIYSLDQAMRMSLTRLDVRHGLLLVSGSKCYVLSSDMLLCMCTQQQNFQALLACIIASPCKCKCKTSLLTNKPFKTADILLLDMTPWGSKIIAETATMLGFILRGRMSKYEWEQATSIDEIHWVGQRKMSDVSLRMLILDKALCNMLRRNKQALSLTASMPARIQFHTAFIASCPLFCNSLYAFTKRHMLKALAIASSTILRRPWIQAKHMAGVFDFIKAPRAMDPEIGAILSKVGLLLRWRGKWALNVILHDLENAHAANLPFYHSLLVQARQAIQKSVSLGDSPIIEQFKSKCHDALSAALPRVSPHSGGRKLKQAQIALRAVLRNAACVQAQGYLRQKVANHAHERQLCAILLALNLPPKNVASDVTRCYALRWAIVEEADAYFVYRQYASRDEQCRVCLRKQTGKELWYDNGFGSMPVCKLCHLNQSCPDDLAHAISCMLPCCDVNQAPLLQCAAMPGAPARTITYRAAIPNEHQCTFIQSHCLLCGLGANTTEHWLTACVVTKASLFIVLVTLGYAGTASFDSLCHTALPKINVEGGIDKKFCAVLLAWIATIRRYTMEQQCTWHPGWCETPQRAKHISNIPKLASRLWNTIPRMLLPKALPAWWVDTERCKPCCNDGGLHIEVKHPLSALIKASAQGVTVSPRNANIGDVLATLDAQHYLLAPMYQQTLGVPNVALWPKMCHCGNLHLKVTALRPIPAGTPLIVELKPVKDTHLVAQFDGSCHVQEGIGGAGGIVWSPGPVPVILETIAIPLQPCPDSMFAEICAADATLDKALSLAASNQIREVILQGDCINIVKHFAGALRLHREDLVRKLDNMWQKLTHTPITVHWSYVPRVGNKVADHLAGIAANSLRYEAPLHEDVFFDSGEGQPHMQINTECFPPILLPSKQWHLQAIQDLHSGAETISLEAPPLWNPELLLRFCLYNRIKPPPELDTTWPGLVQYRRPSLHPQGRYYAIRHWQTSKRPTRFLAIGPNAIEIDMKGAHYTLLRLLTCHSPTHPPLPTLLEARELFSSHLARAPKAQTVQTKHLLQRAVGMDSNAFLRHVYEGSIAAYAIPPALASFLAHLVQAKATLQVMIQQGIPFYQPDARVNNRNWATFALEAAESFVMRKGLAAMLPYCAGTVLWVHDGVYVKNRNAVSPFIEGATEALVQLIQVGQHCHPQVTPNQEFANLQDVFAITTTKSEFNAAVDALNAAGIACHSPALPKRPKATTNRVSKRLILEVQDILEVERQRDDKRRRVDVTAVPRRGLWVTPPLL